MFSQKVTADIIKGLEKGSKTSLKLGVTFTEWLSYWTEKSKTRVEIVYLFEELTSSFGGKFVVVRQFRFIELDRMLSQARVLADKVARARTVVDDLQTGVLTHIGSSTQRWSSCHLLQNRDAMGYLPEEAV